MTSLEDVKAIAAKVPNTDETQRDLMLKFSMLISILLATDVISFEAFKILVEQPDWEPSDYVEAMRAAGGTEEQMKKWESWLEHQEDLKKLSEGIFGDILRKMGTL